MEGRTGWSGDTLVVHADGRIDEESWQAFTDLLLAAVAESKGAALAIDLGAVDYMSSRGLRALTMARKAAGEAAAISLVRPNPRMREILAISRYDRLFPVLDALP